MSFLDSRWLLSLYPEADVKCFMLPGCPVWQKVASRYFQVRHLNTEKPGYNQELKLNLLSSGDREEHSHPRGDPAYPHSLLMSGSRLRLLNVWNKNAHIISNKGWEIMKDIWTYWQTTVSLGWHFICVSSFSVSSPGHHVRLSRCLIVKEAPFW